MCFVFYKVLMKPYTKYLTKVNKEKSRTMSKAVYASMGF